MNGRLRVGYIGVGLMGHGAAKHILRGGYALTVLGHRNRARVDDLVAAGAHEARTPQEVAATCDVVFTCLPSSVEVEATVFGPDGLLAGCHPGMIHVDSTTADPTETRRIGAAYAAQAAQIVASCRYRPAGVRGLAFGMAHDDFTEGDAVRKMAEENARTLVIPLIETATGIANADQIMAVEGIDIGWLGHFDLTNTMGITAQFDHPDFHTAVDTMIAACRRHGKPAGVLGRSLAMVETFRARGFRCLCYKTDIALLHDALRDGLAQLRAGSS